MGPRAYVSEAVGSLRRPWAEYLESDQFQAWLELGKLSRDATHHMERAHAENCCLYIAVFDSYEADSVHAPRSRIVSLRVKPPDSTATNPF